MIDTESYTLIELKMALPTLIVNSDATLIAGFRTDVDTPSSTIFRFLGA